MFTAEKMTTEGRFNLVGIKWDPFGVEFGCKFILEFMPNCDYK